MVYDDDDDAWRWWCSDEDASWYDDHDEDLYDDDNFDVDDQLGIGHIEDGAARWESPKHDLTN